MRVEEEDAARGAVSVYMAPPRATPATVIGSPANIRALRRSKLAVALHLDRLPTARRRDRRSGDDDVGPVASRDSRVDPALSARVVPESSIYRNCARAGLTRNGRESTFPVTRIVTFPRSSCGSRSPSML